MNDGLHNFPGLWKISNSFCVYFCLAWFSPQKDQRAYPYGGEEKGSEQKIM